MSFKRLRRAPTRRAERFGEHGGREIFKLPAMTTLTFSRPHLCLTTWLLGAALLAGASATQAQIKRWVDERGVVHYSDQTPARGETRGPVKTIDTPPPPTALEQVRADRKLEAARDYVAQPSARAASAPAAPASAVPGAPLVGPPRSDPAADAGAQCAAQWRAYDDAYRCMDPYRVQGGGIKAEGYAACPVVREPACDRP